MNVNRYPLCPSLCVINRIPAEWPSCCTVWNVLSGNRINTYNITSSMIDSGVSRLTIVYLLFFFYCRCCCSLYVGCYKNVSSICTAVAALMRPFFSGSFLTNERTNERTSERTRKKKPTISTNNKNPRSRHWYTGVLTRVFNKITFLSHKS